MLSQILGWHKLEKLPRGQPKAAEGLPPLAFYPEDNQGAGQGKSTEEAQRQSHGSPRKNTQIVANLQPQ